jgi:predicted phosphodiesterase
MACTAVISDVHSNLEALNSVLENIEKECADNILFIGDIVGYGPDPNECIEIIRKKSNIVLAGNHDLASVGMHNTIFFNPLARVAIEWTCSVLSDENKDFLSNLPLTERLARDSVFLVHGSPYEPEKWHYVLNSADARKNFDYFKEIICFVGHSHIPLIMKRSFDGEVSSLKDKSILKEKSRYIINTGSVGQPRDGNPDSAYALLRDNTIEIKRVSYDILLTQKKMRKAGLPSHLIDRLSVGR